jgi:hypothetical protein
MSGLWYKNSLHWLPWLLFVGESKPIYPPSFLSQNYWRGLRELHETLLVISRLTCNLLLKLVRVLNSKVWCMNIKCFEQHWPSSGVSKIAARLSAFSIFGARPRLCAPVSWHNSYTRHMGAQTRAYPKNWIYGRKHGSFISNLKTPEDDQCWSKHVVCIPQWYRTDFKVLKNKLPSRRINTGCYYAALHETVDL